MTACECCGGCFAGILLVGAGIRQIGGLVQPSQQEETQAETASAKPLGDARMPAVQIVEDATVQDSAEPLEQHVAGARRSQGRTDHSRELYDATWQGDFDGAFDALEAGADPYARYGVRKITALHVAARTGNRQIMEMLLRWEKAPTPQLDVQNKDGETPLFGAVLEGHVGTTQALVDAKADVNIKDNEGRTVLSIARQRERQDFIDFLTASGAIG
mmetsp:Transcript_29667/g.69922  ORF Transcript_29667/g.69922 Transcript_29667/m.69922 type:complete len:216 (+) Transcript_29667:64-711(+)